jgi:hypothetical protein
MPHVTAHGILGLGLLLTLALGGASAVGAQLYVYPNKGQSSEQQSRDRYECHLWAVQQSGHDPTQAQTAQSPSPPLGGGGDGDAGEGAAIGAATGGLIGGVRQRDQKIKQQQAQAQQSAQQSAASSAYHRAVSACLSGRGYTVK